MRSFDDLSIPPIKVFRFRWLSVLIPNRFRLDLDRKGQAKTIPDGFIFIASVAVIASLRFTIIFGDNAPIK